MFCCCFKFLKRRPKVLIIKIPSPIEEFDNVFYKQELNNIISVSYTHKEDCEIEYMKKFDIDYIITNGL